MSLIGTSTVSNSVERCEQRHRDGNGRLFKWQEVNQVGHNT